MYSGFKELSPPAVNLKKLVKETVCREPILIVISPGADPSQVRACMSLFLVRISNLGARTNIGFDICVYAAL